MASAHRIRFAALALCLALVAGACGGSGDKTQNVSSKQTTTSARDSSTIAGDPSTTNAGASSSTVRGTTGTTVKGSTGSTAKGSATTGNGSAPTTAPTPATTDPNAAPGPAKTGTYGYSQSGSTPDGPVPAHGTLEVSGGTTETFARYYDPSKGPQTLTYAFRSEGPYITAATLRANGATITCSFGSGVPAPPWPPNPGRTFGGSGSCSSPIGQMTASLSGSVTSHSGDIVGLATTVHVYNANNSVDVTVHDTESWSTSLRVPKSSHQTFEGSAFGSPITGDVTSTLASTP